MISIKGNQYLADRCNQRININEFKSKGIQTSIFLSFLKYKLLRNVPFFPCTFHVKCYSVPYINPYVLLSFQPDSYYHRQLSLKN